MTTITIIIKNDNNNNNNNINNGDNNVTLVKPIPSSDASGHPRFEKVNECMRPIDSLVS